MAESVGRSSTSSVASLARRRVSRSEGSASAAPLHGERAPAQGHSTPTLIIERLLWAHGVTRIAGIDEAGRGAWAGPVVAAAVVLPNESDLAERLAGVNDSKVLSPKQRKSASRLIHSVALDIGVGVVPVEVVDHMGLSAAGQLAFWRAVQGLRIEPDHLLVDGFPLWSQRYPQTAVIKGDKVSLSIAAGSIIAKVARDRIMAILHRQIPQFDFVRNRGYGSTTHSEALNRLGPSLHHRRSYAPVASAAAFSHAE